MKKITFATVLLAATTLALPAFAQSQFADFIEGIEARSEASTLSEHVFRGQSRGAQSLVSDSEFTLPFGLSGGFLYNAGIDPDSDVQRDEIRAVSYTHLTLPTILLV